MGPSLDAQGAYNGADHKTGADSVTACGAAARCASQGKVFDLSGNLREWTNTAGAKVSDPQLTRGGAYDSIALGLYAPRPAVSPR